MIRKSLFAKLFFLIIIAILIIIPATYYVTIPMVDDRVYEMEKQFGLTTLDNIYSLLKYTKQDLRYWEQYTLDTHKKKIKDIVTIAARRLEEIRARQQRGEISYPQAIAEARVELSAFSYANNDYLYFSDYDSTFIYHPDPKLDGTNAAQLKDVQGKLIVAPMIEQARAGGDVFYEYWWNRLGEGTPVKKLTYTKDLPGWKGVIGTGIYLDDIQHEKKIRSEAVIGFLRPYIHSIRIAQNGYLYIFDGQMRMIIHPNANIENTDFSEQKNPLTGQSIGRELMAVAHSEDNHFVYKWDKPSDPGNYCYDKEAWVRYLPEFDYYLASSVYMDDMKSNGTQLAKHLFAVDVVFIFIFAAGGLALIYSVTSDLKRLSMTADAIVAGDLNRKVNIDRHDEIGKLAGSFNHMIDKLKDQIDHLELRVEQRTEALSDLVQELERNNVETRLLKEANELLQACRNEQEVPLVVRQVMIKAFYGIYGSLYLLVNNGRQLELVCDWNGSESFKGEIFSYESCIALRRGDSYCVEDSGRQLPCTHSHSDSFISSVCMPVKAYGETFGVLYAECSLSDPEQTARAIELLRNIAEYTAKTLANLRLRSHLHQQSIRDPLTGLFNRRFMEETLHQEENRARRNNSQVAIMMIDVDHFKPFNDNYGHEAGDDILKLLGVLLKTHFRDSDIPCRYGGEEFVVILPNLSSEQALAKAESLRLATHDRLKIHRATGTLGVTLSVGVALYPHHGHDFSSVLKRADEALYQAKEQGRDRVVIFSSSN